MGRGAYSLAPGRTRPVTDGYQLALELILPFIKSYWLEHGYSPAVEDICKSCQLSRSSINYWSIRFRQNGDLLYEDGTARSFRLPGQRVVFD